MEFESTARKWGNSIGIRIPKKVAKALGIRPNQKVKVVLQEPGSPLVKYFGTLKGGPRNIQKFLDQVDRELYDD